MSISLTKRTAPMLLLVLLAAPLAAQEPAEQPILNQEPVQKEKAETPPAKVDDIFNLPLEQLGQVPARVQAGFDQPATSVGRELDFPAAAAAQGQTGTTVGTSPAAVYVLTEEDIRRSGIRALPDLFRMVPGMDVARLDANKWVVSSRGFNGVLANKLLVQQDGRSIYTPLFGGVFWDQHDVVLEDLERIEVIRGPGATLWGSNAVNGIISIISKPASATQGWLISGLGGSEELGETVIRYGGALGPDTHYRVWMKYWDWGNGVLPDGRQGFDGWDMGRAGFRLDSEISGDERFMIQGDLYQADLGQTLFLPFVNPPSFRPVNDQYHTRGGFILGRYTRTLSEDSNVSLQFYYDRNERHEFLAQEDRDIIDLDFQHRFALNARNEVVWGAGYRYTTDHIGGSPPFSIVDPTARGDNWASTFIQDDWEVVEKRLHLIGGSKFEYNDYTGFEIQPSGRFLWTPDDRQTIWGAISRAVRIPTRADENIDALLTPPFVIPPGLIGQTPFISNVALESEEVISYELGYRRSLTDRLGIDIAGFFNDYDRLFAVRPLPPVLGPFPQFFLPLEVVNGMSGETYGTEVAVNWKVTDDWQLHAGYTWLRMQLHAEPGVLATSAEGPEGSSPRNQFNIRSFWNVTPKLQFDTAAYYVENLPALDVPSYVRLDARLAWMPRPGLEMIVGLQNLLQPDHLEFRASVPAYQSTEAERSIYGMVRWRF